jgi:hypothetical protein
LGKGGTQAVSADGAGGKTGNADGRNVICHL